MALTDIAVRTAKPEEKDRKLSDGDGLYGSLTFPTLGHYWWYISRCYSSATTK
jgi:hypothetical protein